MTTCLGSNELFFVYAHRRRLLGFLSGASLVKVLAIAIPKGCPRHIAFLASAAGLIEVVTPSLQVSHGNLHYGLSIIAAA